VEQLGISHRHRWSRLAFAAAAALTVLSMLRYPGGTVLDPSTRGYSLTRNFLSDLGMTVSYSQEPNLLGAVLFTTALLTLLAGVFPLLFHIARLCSRPPGARGLARAASVVVLCSCLLFAGVAFTPENRLMALHVDFTRFAFRVAPLATLLLTVAVVRLPDRPRRVVNVLGLFSVALVAYVGILDWGPDVLTPSGLVVQVAAQKCIAAIAVVAFLALSVELERWSIKGQPSSGRA
jgi:hypothetical membrane protein